MKNRSSFCKVSTGMLIFALSTPALLVGCSSPQPKTEGAVYDTGKVAEYATPYVSYDANYNTEEYNAIDESNFKAVATSPLSTFAADVDTASYANIRRFINFGELPPADAVRIEEMLNYFHYDYPQPNEGEPFSVTTEISACPWNPDTKLMMVGMQAKQVDELEKKPSNLVFLIDVSGSMDSPDKLPLVKNAFLLLCEQLKENDTISIVTYAGSDQIVLEGAKGSDSKEIMAAIEDLEAGGSTAGSEGIKTAYEIARKYFKADGNNRVILATDGDLNVGITSEGELTRLIKKEKESGVFLSVLGFGTENIKDNKMEALADNGNGNYSYIDSRFEAKKVLSEELGANFFTVAKDVKFQLEFNPKFIKGYRLIGYENRIMDDEDFKDDTKDGGEIGSVHRVTVLYEIVDKDSPMDIGSDLKYQSSAVTESNDLLNIAVRYKEPDSETSKELNYPVTTEDIKTEMSDNMKFASAVAETGMLLRDSEFKGKSSYDDVESLLNSISDIKSDTNKLEFLLLVKKIASMTKEQ
ncbi:PF12034 domain protein [Lachnoanaerobaculum sp. ICM7]|uniref:vWA domain-containing protein n=1 Tax=Lachnoanaerobaculum sp. ICM7 TaxID=936594 RepID=UPI00027A57B9|nr:VWA domain-containing protein [Lachnoanaerobaculum sp. ICM7]EJP22563.1 PF12034 domain protein [Lachnoanaerobaculum sp. ICM7]